MEKNNNQKISKSEKIENLLTILSNIENVEDRIELIYKDVQKKRPKFKVLANSNPYLFFELLGGDISNVEPTHNWALKYTYDDFKEYNGIEDDEYDDDNDLKEDIENINNKEEITNDFTAAEDEVVDEENWDIEGESIDHAIETGHWFVTGFHEIIGSNDICLSFEFSFCEGYLDGIIGNPYNEHEHGGHGFLFEL